MLHLRKLILVSVFSIVCVVPPLALAQQSAAKKSGDIEVVVTASRGTEENALEVPQAIKSIKQEQIATGEYQDVDNVIRDIPNIGLAPTEGNPNYWQEGFTIRGLGAQRVLILSDGVRQAGQGIGYGGGNLSLYDSYSIDKIEVLKGPGSVLYGTDAFGGVINILTRQPKRRTEWGTNYGARYSYDGIASRNRGGAYLDFGDSDWGMVAGGSYANSDRPNLPDDFHADNGSYRQWSFWGKADYFIDSNSKLRFIADLNNTKDVLVSDSVMPLPIALFPPPGESELIFSPLYFNFPKYRRSLLGLEYITEDISPSIEELKSGVYWQRLDRVFHRETAFYPTGSPGFAGPPLFVDPSSTVTQSRVDTNDQMNTIEWQTQARFNVAETRLTAGFDLGFDGSDLPESEVTQVVGQAGVGHVRGDEIYTLRKRADATQMRYGIFAQDQAGAGDFIFTPGVRLDLFDVKDDVSNYDDTLFGVSGSLGTTYRLAEEQSIYLNLGSGFRAPDLGERFQNGIVNLGVPSRLVGDADLDPERAYSAELGTKSYAERYTFDAAFFYSRVDDYIGRKDLGFIDGFATEQYANLGEVDLFGPEAALTFKLTDQLELNANAGRTFTPDDEKVDVPDWAFNYGLSYTFCTGMDLPKSLRTSVSARTLLNSEQKTVSAGREPFPDNNAFTTMDIKLDADLGQTALGHGSLVGGLRNVFDQAYREPFYSAVQAGRNAYVGVQFDF